MIKGDIEHIKLKMNSGELISLVATYEKQEAINIMGKRYFIVGIDVKQHHYNEKGEAEAIVIVKVRTIKKG